MQMNNDFLNKLQDITKRVPQAVKHMPGIAKVEGLHFIADNFENEGFETTTGSYRKWAKKKKKDARTKILIGEKRGSRLKKSWKANINQAATEFSSELPYAAVHNEGLQAGRPPGFTMPQRQMIGDSPALLVRIEKKVDSLMNDIFS